MRRYAFILFILLNGQAVAEFASSSLRASNDAEADSTSTRELVSNGHNVRKVANAKAVDLDDSDEENIARQGSSASGSQLTPYKGKLYFRSSNERTPQGIELYVYDEETDSVELVQDINPGYFSSFPSSLFVYDGKLYFAADDGEVGSELWVYDGKTASLELDVWSGPNGSGPRNFVGFEKALCFVAEVNSNRGLWCYDVEAGVADKFAEQQIQSNLVEFDKKLFFVTDNELFYLDPDTAEVVLEADQFRPSGGNKLTELKGELCFSARTDSDGHELWCYDGKGAYQVKDIWPGIGSSFPQGFTVYGNKLFFSAADGRNGNELWSYDGYEAALVADINPGSASSEPTDLVVFDGKLYFAATDPVVGREIFSYDGFTVSVAADVIPGPISSNPTDLVEFNHKLYFFADPDQLYYLIPIPASTPAPAYAPRPSTAAPFSPLVPTPNPTPAPTRPPSLAAPTTPRPSGVPSTASPTVFECELSFVGSVMASFRNFFAGGGI